MAYDFHWWVHSVLPLVFDNSLSYYEVLAKLTNYVDGLTGDVKKITDVLGTIEGIEDVTAFTEYLNSINAKIGELDGLDTESKNNLVAAVNEAYELAKNAYVKPAGGIPERDLSQELINKINSSGGSSGGSGGGTTNYQALSNLPSINGVTLYGNVTGQTLGLGTYSKPSGGIPMDDLSTDVQNAIRDAGSSGGGGSGESGVTNYDALSGRPQINGVTLTGNKTAAQLNLGTYNLPADGIPWSQLSEDVQTRISAGGGSGGGVTDYSALTGKPSINGHILNSGNNDLATLGIGTYNLPAGGIPENQLNTALANKINQAYNGVNTNDTKFSGIASQLSNFTSDRRYEAGELLYINGVMYKTKNVILAGNTLVEGNNIERATVSDEIVRLNELEQKISASSNFNSFDINSNVRMNSTIETPVKVVEGINCIGGETYLIDFYMENYNFQSGLLVNIKIKGHLDNTVYEHRYSARDSVNVQSITFEPSDTDTYYITAEYKANNGPAIRIYMSVKYTTSQGITYIHDTLQSLEGVPDDVAAAVELVEQQQQRMDNFEDEYGDIPERVGTLESDADNLKSALNFNKTATPGYLLRATNNGNGSEWVAAGLPTDEQTERAVSEWLDEHPEATTTVQDGAITEAKLNDELKPKIMKDYITPEMHGAIGDGKTDDSAPFQAAVNECLNSNKTLLLVTKYAINNITINGKINMLGLSDNNSGLIDISGDTPMLTISNASYSVFENFNVKFISQRSVPVFDISDSHSLELTGLVINSISYAGTPNVPTIKIYRKTPGSITYLTRITRCKLIYTSIYLESTDSIIINNVFNGVYNNHALTLYQSDNTIIEGNEIVPGIESAINIDGEHNVNGLKINGNYFDGGTDSQDTGCAIYSSRPIVNSVICSNNFWHIKKEGILLHSIRYSNICDNVFEECGYTDQTANDITIEDLSFAINVNSNNFYRMSWYHNNSVVNRDNSQCYFLYLGTIPSSPTYMSHIISNIVNESAKYLFQEYGEYYINLYNRNVNQFVVKTISLSKINNYISAVPSCVTKNNNVNIDGLITVITEIPAYAPFIKNCPLQTVRNFNGIMFNNTGVYEVYVDTAGIIHAGSFGPIPTGTYRLLLQYFT